MTSKEIELFHKNLNFMWQKLSTTHYHAKNMTNTAKAMNIIGGSDLPAYNLLSKCKNDANFEPPISAVNSIVQFYNRNILPKVDTYQFLHEDLSQTGDIRHRTNTIMSNRFVGTYYCFYPSPSEKEDINSGILQIYEDSGLYKAAFVIGVRNDEALTSPELQSIFKQKPNERAFKKYYSAQDKNNQRCSYFEGIAEITSKSLLIHFYEPSGEFKKLELTMNLVSYPISKMHSDGGIGYLLITSDGSYDTRFCKMGFTNIVNGCLSMSDDRVKDALSFRDIRNNNLIMLTSASDRIWYDLILRSLKDDSLIVPAQDIED